MTVKCKYCGTTVTTKILEVGKQKAAQCPYCGQVAWTDIKEDVIIVFYATSGGHGFKVYPGF